MGSLRLDLMLTKSELKYIHFTGNECPLFPIGKIGPPPSCGWLLLDGWFKHTTGTATIYYFMNKDPYLVNPVYTPKMIHIDAGEATDFYPLWTAETVDILQTTLFDDKSVIYCGSSGDKTFMNFIRVLEWNTIESPQDQIVIDKRLIAVLPKYFKVM